MKVKELIAELSKFNHEAEILVSSDEELNTLYKGLEVAEIEDLEEKPVVIYGLSGTEKEQ
jgi:hypothetical protein